MKSELTLYMGPKPFMPKTGILKDIWVAPDLKKNIIIWEVDTPEDIGKLFIQYPVAP